MASVQNVHKYLTQTYLGNVRKQMDLEEAVAELKERMAKMRRVPRLCTASSPQAFAARESGFLPDGQKSAGEPMNPNLAQTSISPGDKSDSDAVTVHSGDKLYTLYTGTHCVVVSRCQVLDPQVSRSQTPCSIRLIHLRG